MIDTNENANGILNKSKRLKKFISLPLIIIIWIITPTRLWLEAWN